MTSRTNPFVSIFAPLFLLLTLLGTLASCNSSEKALTRGDYDDVISKSISKLQKNKSKEKYVLLLEDAYSKANERELNQIDLLKRSGTPANFLQIYEAYKKLDMRQARVKPLLPLYAKKEGREAIFSMRNYNQDIVHYRNQASDFLYTKAMFLLKDGDKFDAREAFALLMKVDRIFPGFRDLNEQLDRANAVGSNNILVRVKNGSSYPISPTVIYELEHLNVEQFDQLWADFHYKEEPGVAYDYMVVLQVDFAEAGPEQIREELIKRTNEIQIGTVSQNDIDGQVSTDTSSRSVEVPILKTVYAEVLHTTLHKEASIAGQIDFLDVRSERLMASYPIETRTVFDYEFASWKGDKRALESADKQLAKNNPIPFPSDHQMLIDAAVEIKSDIKSVIRSNDELVMD